MLKKYLVTIECPCNRTKKLDRVMTMGYEARVASFDMTFLQFTLLRIIERIGPISMTELAKFAVMDRTTLSRNLKKPFANGWIAFKVGPNDGRKRLISITPKGTAQHEKAKLSWDQEQIRIIEILGMERFEALNKLLNESAALILKANEQKTA